MENEPDSINGRTESCDVSYIQNSNQENQNTSSRNRVMPGTGRDYFYPFAIVWTPIPLLTWLFPYIGHMGITTSSGAIRDFAGPFFVAECDMAFGRPTKFVVLNPDLARGSSDGWDEGVHEASEIYKQRMHNLFCDNCHSHVATALNKMHYDGSTSWNMVKLALLMVWRGRYVSFRGWLITWLPFLLLASSLAILFIFLY